MDKAIITALMVIAGVIAAVLVFNAIYPATIESSDAMANMERRIDERLKSQVEIIHATGSGTFSDVALVWVKNIGALPIKPPERCDVFFGPEGDFARIPYGEGASHWDFEIENDADWKPTATLRITIDLDYDLSAGERYFVKVVTPNGVSDEAYFSK